jgi:hypothetical protein
MFWVIIALIVLAILIKSLISRYPDFFLRLALILGFPAFFAFVYFISDIDTAIGASILVAVIGLLIFISSAISSTFERFYNLKTILKFLAIKLFTPGITDKQKINKIKKINGLALYGKEHQKLAKEKREKEYKKAEDEKFDKMFLKCTKSYKKIVNAIEKEMSEYINSGYISLEFTEPTRSNIIGYIFIHSKMNNSILKIASRVALPEYENTFKVYEIETIEELVPYKSAQNFSSNSHFATIGKAKKYLLKYFESYPEELGE